MIIKSMTLKNFRQYKDAKIEFSNTPGKNVTIIMGDNGTGKTTLAQAFQWVLYGKTQFQITEVINRIVRESMTMGQTKSVSVSLEILYNNVVYTLTRTLAYKKNSSMKIEQGEGKFTISYIGENGVVEYIPEFRKNYFIKRVLPQELSKFFFFDGERIEEMSREIQGGQSEDFKEAVYSLVGLTATQNAIQHFKPRMGNKKSVIKVFKDEIDKNNKSAEAMKAYNEKIERLNDEIEKLISKEKELKNEIDNANTKIKQNEKIIMEESDKMELKSKYMKLSSELIALKRKRNEIILMDVIKPISGNFYDFCMQPIMDKAKQLITNDAPDDKIIPGLTSKTINHLLHKRKSCLCGTSLSEGSLAFKAVEELLEYSYPKTIASLKEDYKKTFNSISKNKDYYDTFTKRIKNLYEQDAVIEAKEIEKDELMEQISNTDRGETAKKQNAELERIVKVKTSEQINISATLQNKTKERDRQETEKGNLVIIDEETKRNQRYLAYATYIYEKMFEDYSKQENSYRLKLQSRMNDIFEKIYDGNILITVDPKYKIKVKIDEEYASEEEVEKNTAQGYALIFAFITAIIDLAKEKVNQEAFDEKERIDVEKEGYPLVMDAPLSAFDKTRIKKICYEIPRIADQVIMFIKDTDGDIAEEHMSSKIGKKYLIEKIENSNLNSGISER